MILEFKRFGLNDFQRSATGILQLFGAAGLIVGLFVPIIGLLASAGLATMMLIAFLVRVKIGDGILQSAPAILFLLLNGWISGLFYTLI